MAAAEGAPPVLLGLPASAFSSLPLTGSSTAKEIAAGTRLYGLVDGHLLWAWDIAAFGQELRSHASARLARAE